LFCTHTAEIVIVLCQKTLNYIANRDKFERKQIVSFLQVKVEEIE